MAYYPEEHATRELQVDASSRELLDADDFEDDASAIFDCEPSAVPADALAQAFCRGGSWRISGELPPGNFWMRQTEAPFHTREFQVSPAHLRKRGAQAMLEKWGVAVINTKGCKGGNSAFAAGQDNFCVARLPNGWEVFGVFDGHGHGGHWPSERAARTVPFFLQGRHCSGLFAAGDAEGALHYAVLAAEMDLEAQAKNAGIDIQGCGSTAVVALRRFDADHVYVATVGDSRAALLRVPSGDVLAETSDHKPSRKDEALRIEKSGGTVCSSKHSDGVDCRIYHRGCDYPGIAVSRSLGDCGVKSIGVSAEPEIVRWPMKGNESAYLLLCSDGVWEFLSTAQVSHLVASALKRGESPLAALQELLEVTRAQWKCRIIGGVYCDDISMVLVPLGAPQAPRWDSLAVSPSHNPAIALVNKVCLQSCGFQPFGSNNSSPFEREREAPDSDSDASSLASERSGSPSPSASPRRTTEPACDGCMLQ